MNRLALCCTIVAPLAIACTEAAPSTPSVPSSPLARCADPAAAVTTRWQVDNQHAPITAITRTGRTIVVTSGDGAVKLWNLSPAGSTLVEPGYGEPLRTSGTMTRALTANDRGAVAVVDATGVAAGWQATGAPLFVERPLVTGAAVTVALDDDAGRLATASDAFAGELTVADLGAGTHAGPLPTDLWNIAATVFAPGGDLVTVGHWYSCPAIELRDHADPTVVTGYWHTCQPGGDMAQGWFRSAAIDAAGTTALAGGDQLLAAFDLSAIDDGPTATAITELVIDRVIRLDGDGLAITLGHRGDASELTWWSTTDLTVRRTIAIPSAVALAVEPTTGVAVVASADGTLRGMSCE